MKTRMSSFKTGGGGFLNGKDVTIQDYQFTDEFNGKPFEPGKMRDLKGKLIDKPHSLNCYITFLEDGASETVSQNLRVATRFEDWDVTDDGHTITPSEGANLGGSSAFGKFMTSWEQASGQGAESAEVEEGSFNYEAIIGSRVRLIRRPYSAEELERVKRLGAPIKRTGKDGKEYNRESLVCETVYELAQPEAKGNGKAKGGKVAQKGAQKAQAAPSDDLAELAQVALLEILEAAGGAIAKTKLSLKTLTTPSLKGNPLRDEVRKWMFEDQNLAALVTEGVITYNKAKGEIAVV